MFLIPIIAGSLIQQLYTTVDAIIVGQFVGKTGLAAIDSVYTLFKFPLNFLSGLSAGATIMVSKYFGQKNNEEIDCAIHTGYTVAIILGFVFSLIGVLFTPQLLHIMAVPDDIYQMTALYCRIYFAGLWTMTLYNMVAGILRAFGDSRSPFVILIACCVINVAGDFLLVGAFHMGVAGAAIATIVAQLVSAMLAMQMLSKTHNHCHNSVWHLFFCKEHIMEIITKGFPIGLQGILFPIANSIIQASINNMGTDVIAAWAVVNKLDLLIWLIADATSPALSTYVSQNLGAKKKDRIFKGACIGTAFGVICVALISLVLFLVPGPLGRLFISSKDAEIVIPYVVTYLKMMAPFYVFYALAEGMSGTCCGMGDTLKPMIVTMLCTCGLRVVGIFFVLPHYRSMECIVVIYILSWIVTGITFLGMFLVKNRKLTLSDSACAA